MRKKCLAVRNGIENGKEMEESTCSKGPKGQLFCRSGAEEEWNST